MKHVAHHRDPPDWRISQSDTDEHAGGVSVPVPRFRSFVDGAPLCIPLNSLSARGAWPLLGLLSVSQSSSVAVCLDLKRGNDGMPGIRVAV